MIPVVKSALSRRQLITLIAGDVILLLVITLLGFATHRRGLTGGRWLTTFLPLVFSWFLAAPLTGLYRAGVADRLPEFWRTVITGVLAASLAVLLRGIWLRQPVIPVFGLVMMAMTAAVMGVWRLVWAAISSRKP